MIHFFRRIRQKLFSEGKVSKYLLYAIGEIALVMIGIPFNTGKLYDLTNEILVDQIINYYKTTDQQIYLLRQSRNEFRAFFYGAEFNDYWVIPGEPDPSKQMRLAMEIMNNKNSRIHSLMNQASAWSVAVITGARDANQALLQENRSLFEAVRLEVPQGHEQ